MDSISPWYRDLSQIPYRIRKEFPKKFSSLTTKVIERISHLITIFGYLNYRSIKTLLPGDVQLYYSREMQRIKLVQHICLMNLIKNIPFNQLEIENNHLYDHISGYSSNSTKVCVELDIKIYLSSVTIPLQEAKALGCYSVVWMKKFIDDYDIRLQSAIMDLFDWTKQMGTNSPPTIEQQLLLFKHAAINWFDQPLSFGAMLYLWLKQQAPSELIDKQCTWMENQVTFFILLHGGKQPPPSHLPPIDVFQEFVIQNTLDILFHDEKSLLSDIEGMKKNLAALFLHSEQDRQAALYFIDHLHSVWDKIQFSFLKSFEILNRLVSTTSKLYNPLHAILNYFRCLQELKPPEKMRKVILHSLYDLSLTERQKFDMPIKEKFKRERLVVDESLHTFIETHFEEPKLWAEILLRQITIEGTETSPYFKPNQHIELIMEFEKFFAIHLPIQMISYLLIFQTAKSEMKKVCEEFEYFKFSIEQDFSEQADYFERWKILNIKFMAQIDPPKGPEIHNWTLIEVSYLRQMQCLSFLFQFQSFPKFQSTVPDSLNKMQEWQSTTYSINDEVYKETFNKYFLPYLKELPIEQGVIALYPCLPNKNSPIYNSLHSILHTHHVMKLFSLKVKTTSEVRKFITSAISSMTLQERQKFDEPLVEDYILEPLQIDADFLQFVKKHQLSPSACGKMILRSVRTCSLNKQVCPYLNFKQHLQLIQEIESYIGVHLPISLVEDFLYFQVAKASLSSILQNFLSLQRQIKQNFLSSISIPSDLHEKRESLSMQVIYEGMGNLIYHLNLYASNDRAAHFQQEVIAGLGSILAFVTYPRSLVSLLPIISFQTRHAFYPFNLRLPKGPAWMARWITNETKEYTLSVLTTNLVNSNASCLFNIPLKVPDGAKAKTRFFHLLSLAINAFGKEGLNEIEHAKCQRDGQQIQPLITQEMCQQNDPYKSIQSFLHCSPLVEHEWNNYFLGANENDQISLFNFVLTLRTHFLRSFFYTINPNEKNLIENEGFKSSIKMDDQGIHLRNPAVKLGWVCINKESHRAQLIDIYQKITNTNDVLVSRKNLCEVSVPFKLFILADEMQKYTWKGRLEWKVHFEQSINTADQSYLTNKSESVQFQITVPAKLIEAPITPLLSLTNLEFSPQDVSNPTEIVQSLTIHYSSFTKEEEFVESMLWHIALLYLEIK